MITVVVPVYNESDILGANIVRLAKAMDSLGRDYEIIIAEDGSTDGSLAVAEKLKSRRVRILNSGNRIGRGLTLRNAMIAAKGGIIVHTDADLATDPMQIEKLIAGVENGLDICVGSRLLPGSKVHGRSLAREVSSRGYNLLVRALFKTSVRDHQCGFKAFRKSTLLPMLEHVQDRHWFWDTELLIRAQSKGLRVSEIPVAWTDRSRSNVRLSSDILYMGLAALRLRLRI